MRNNLISALLLSDELDQGKSTWVRKVWKQRKQQGHYDTLIQEMRLRDHEMFFNYFRMVPSMFDELLRLVGPSLVKKTTNLREPISAEIRLAITLRYLAAGESKASLSFNYRVARSTVCEILDEVPAKILGNIDSKSKSMQWFRLSLKI